MLSDLLREEQDIRVNWRAAIVFDNGEKPFFGHVKTVGKRRVVVRLDHNLQSGVECDLTFLLPRTGPGEPRPFVEGRAVVHSTVLAEMQFHVTLDFKEIKGDGETLLGKQVETYRAMWQ